MRSMMLLSVMILAALAGCHKVTEFKEGERTSLTFIRTSDFQVEKTMEGFERGRTLVSMGSGKLVLLTADGTLHRIDTAAMQVDTSYTIGGSSGIGYTDAALARNGSLYVLGPGSQVIEVDLSTNSVADNFTPGSRPSALAASPTLDRIYFIDTAENYIGEIITSGNSTGFMSHTGFPPADVMVEPFDGKKIIAACSNSSGCLYGIWLDISFNSYLIGGAVAGSPVSAVIPMTSDSVYAVSCPVWSGSSGYVSLIEGYMVPERQSTIGVEGHPVDMCFNRSAGHMGHLSVLGRTDSGNTVLTVIGFGTDYLNDSYIEAVIDLNGFPRDVISPGNGEYVIVLTSD